MSKQQADDRGELSPRGSAHRYLRDLPVSECLSEVVNAVAKSIPVVLKAPPGAGKTTGVPPALLDGSVTDAGRILLVQPRRLAARAAASRLAFLTGTKLGREVGYHVRFDKRTSPGTKLIAMTTGVLLRMLQSDPLLEDVDCVLLDEFHERSLDSDLALGMLQRIRTTLRPELKLVVMSATLDPQPIMEFLGSARAVSSQGRAFPVSIQHTKMISRDFLDGQIAAVLPEILDETDGHLLVFLPGLGEIRRTRRTIESMPCAADCSILELYGDLPPRDQDAVLAETNRRKIILSTNVAETSITIPGVTGVIDSGLARVMRFDARLGLPKLQLEPISQASAEQRSGRAGRTAPGVCYRLWPAASHRSRRSRDSPEIERGDLSAAVLTLAAWGERDVMAFPWLTPPPADAVAAAGRLLAGLDAIDDEGALTDLGRGMLTLPLHPRLARFMIEARDLGIDHDAALAAAMLTERDAFGGEPGTNARVATSHHRCDVADRLDRLKACLRGRRSDIENVSAANHVQRVADQILRTTRSNVDSDAQRRRGLVHPASADSDVVGVAGPQTPHLRPANHCQSGDEKTAKPSGTEDRLQRALLAAFPDRLARRRSPDSDRGIMVGGRGVRLDRRSSARPGELFLCIDVDGAGIEATVRVATVVQQQWLDPRRVRETDQLSYHPQLEAVVARRRRCLADLVLSETPIACQPGPHVAELLAAAARMDRDRIWPPDRKPLVQFIDRVGFLCRRMPELELPLLDQAAMDEVLLSLCQTRTSFEQLQSAPWLDQLRGRYDYQQMQWIERHAPARMTVPSGNSLAIEYAEGKPPIMRVRIQEIFGWKETPRIAGGNAALQLHLLGPNHRPQQITEDLASFWRETYMHIRKELRRRYPKHHWPEDPMTAKATRNGLKPRD